MRCARQKAAAGETRRGGEENLRYQGSEVPKRMRSPAQAPLPQQEVTVLLPGQKGNWLWTTWELPCRMWKPARQVRAGTGLLGAPRVSSHPFPGGPPGLAVPARARGSWRKPAVQRLPVSKPCLGPFRAGLSLLWCHRGTRGARLDAWELLTCALCHVCDGCRDSRIHREAVSPAGSALTLDPRAGRWLKLRFMSLALLSR